MNNPLIAAEIERALCARLMQSSTSGVVHQSTCLLYYVEHSPTDAAALIEYEVYDGHDANGKLLFKVEQLQADAHFRPPIPIMCQSGLYINHTSNVKNITVQIMPLKHNIPIVGAGSQ